MVDKVSDALPAHQGARGRAEVAKRAKDLLQIGAPTHP
jgi:hypothetical protein